MIILTNIKAIGESGKESYLSAESPKELLFVMQQEKVKQCKITVNWLGQEIVKNRIVSIDEVKQWISENSKT